MQEIKILSSNFTLQEQNHSIKSNLLNLNKAGISIFNSSYSGFFDGNTGIFESLKETEQTDIKEKINIVFSSNIVKFIIKSLIKNPINRIFTIVCNDKKCIIKDHLLSSELLFNSISSYDGEIQLDLSFINAFRLNNKTCNSNSYIYLTNSYIIYENIRGNKKSIYLKKKENIMNIFKKKSFFQLLLIGLMVTNSWSMNAEFKTKFVDSAEDVKKTDTKQSSTDAISSEPKELEVSMGQTTSYLRDVAETACLSKDGITLCPLTAVECKKDIELTDGLSKKVKKTIRKEKQSGLCTSDFKEDKNGCYKDYYYYNYSCSANEVGPLKKTGFDCSGDCGEFGCFCNPEKIEGNCEIVSNKCPINESLPCVNTLEGEGLEKPKTIYSAGSSKKTETEILGLKNCAGVLSNDKCLLVGKEITFTCDEGFELKNNKCVKIHSWYEYSCPSGYEIVYKGNSSLDSKPTPPENNCLKVIEKKEKTYKYKRELKLKEMAPYGSISPKEFDFIRGFSHPENKIESITKIIGNSNTLTFFKGSKKYEIVVDNCLFTGEITADRLKGLIGNNTLKPVNGSGEIKSNCIINGFVGGPDRKEGIVAAKVVDNKLVFWDSFIDGDLGYLKFYTSVDNSFDLPTLGSIYNNGFTHYASIKKHSDMNGEKYKKHGLYITKVQGNKTLDAIKLTKFEERTGFDSFKCSTGCIDGMCSTATCKSGTYGVIRTKGEFIDEETCTNQTCDGYKKFNPYCGVELGSNCDTTKPGVFMKDGKCFEKACFSGKFNAETGKCE